MGKSANGVAAFKSTSPTLRRPKDSEKNSSDIFNQMASMLGIEALRSNSIFTTSDSHLAKDYGELYCIFPFDSCKFSWSETQVDLVVDYEIDKFITNNLALLQDLFQDEYEKYTDLVYSDDKKATPSDIAYFKLLEKMSYLEPDESERAKYKKIGEQIRRVMPTSPLLLAKVDKDREYDLEAFQDVYQLASDKVGFKSPQESLSAALDSGHEILIHGQYIAVKEDLWPYIKDLL